MSTSMELDPTLSLLIRKLYATSLRGKEQTPLDKLAYMRQFYDIAAPPSLEPLCPFFFSFDNKPLNLSNHAPLAPMFKTDRPQRLLYKSSRQIGKSLNSAQVCLLMPRVIPNFNILVMTPLGEQIKRFSTNYIKQLIDGSPVRSLLVGAESQTMFQKSFPNYSKLLFSFASQSADRIRGINADFIYMDEVQDFVTSNISVIEAAASASKKEYYQYSGTPKSMDNTIQGLWLESSQAEWFVPCPHCNRENIPSLEYHIEDMIGPYTKDISPAKPGTVCYHCKRQIFPRQGFWVHKYPERASYFAGYHVSQVIMPGHFENPNKWFTLWQKRTGGAGTSYATFCNEILGESVDAGQKLISLTDLKTAACLPWENNPETPRPEVFERLPRYTKTVLAADWGGGGEKLTSFTTLALMGILPDGTIDCLWGKRLLSPGNHVQEGLECRRWLDTFKPTFMVHDYTGAGALRETILVERGVPVNRIIPIQLVNSTRGNILDHHPATPEHLRAYYSADKTRSLLYTASSIQQGKLRFFQYDGDKGTIKDSGKEERLQNNMSLLNDFLALIEEKMTSVSTSDTYTINKQSNATDDFAQAVNLGCLVLWKTTGAWPVFSSSIQEASPDYVGQLESFDDLMYYSHGF